MQRALHYSHTLLDQLIQRFPDGFYIDATLGKGNDTAFILQHPEFQGQVASFDIQKAALDLAETRLSSLPQRHRAQLYLSSHDQVETLLVTVPEFSGAIYNLGYLPGGNHEITTEATSTIRSLHQVAQKLRFGGQIILVIYSGHPQGQIEKDALFSELAQWSQESFQVLHYGFINQRNQPPQLLVIERISKVEPPHNT